MAAQAEQAKLKKRLEALLKLPENQICADCKKRGPRWASANLGVFFCIECSGIHRNLGVHISFVRSVNLDTWTKAQVDFLEEWGNARANEYYEANIPPNVYRPKEGDSVRVIEKYIRDKYEHKRYIAKSVPPKRETAVQEEDEDDAPRRRGTLSSKKTVTPSVAISRPVAVSAPVSAKAAPVAPVVAEAPSLIDFMDEPVAPPQPPAPVVTQQPTAAFGGEWGSFSSAPNPPTINGFGFDSAPAAAPQSTDMFSSFASSPAPAPQKPQASADAILSLYGGPPQSGFSQQPQGWGAPQGMAAMNGMGTGYPQQPMGGGFPQANYPQQFGGGMGGGYPQQGNGMGMGMGPQPGYGAPAYGQQQGMGMGMGGGAGFQQGGAPYHQPHQPMYGQYPQQQQQQPQAQPVNPFAQMGNPQQYTGMGAPVNPFQQHQQPQQPSGSQYPFPNGFGSR